MSGQGYELRKRVAGLARDLYAGKLTWEQFMDQVPETEDDDVAELVDLIEHEPKKGGLLGVNAKAHQDYLTTVFALISKLEQGG
jgi:hypothetical protein